MNLFVQKLDCSNEDVKQQSCLVLCFQEQQHNLHSLQVVSESTVSCKAEPPHHLFPFGLETHYMSGQVSCCSVR